MQLFVEKNRSVRDILFGFLLAEILQISVWEIEKSLFRSEAEFRQKSGLLSMRKWSIIFKKHT